MVLDFRPISLVTSVYKVICKVLSVRLGEVLGDTFWNQSAFAAGRQIPDIDLVAYEIVKDIKRRRQKGFWSLS